MPSIKSLFQDEFYSVICAIPSAVTLLDRPILTSDLESNNGYRIVSCYCDKNSGRFRNRLTVNNFPEIVEVVFQVSDISLIRKELDIVEADIYKKVFNAQFSNSIKISEETETERFWIDEYLGMVRTTFQIFSAHKFGDPEILNP
jgi:hypothetical protein